MKPRKISQFESKESLNASASFLPTQVFADLCKAAMSKRQSKKVQ